jgi:hypothetical protein
LRSVHATTVSLDGSSCNRQPNSHALRLGREERFKHLLYLVRQNAGTGVGNRHFGKMVDACQLEDWWVAIPAKAGIADAYVEQALIWSSALDFER